MEFEEVIRTLVPADLQSNQASEEEIQAILSALDEVSRFDKDQSLLNLPEPRYLKEAKMFIDRLKEALYLSQTEWQKQERTWETKREQSLVLQDKRMELDDEVEECRKQLRELRTQLVEKDRVISDLTVDIEKHQHDTAMLKREISKLHFAQEDSNLTSQMSNDLVTHLQKEIERMKEERNDLSQIPNLTVIPEVVTPVKAVPEPVKNLSAELSRLILSKPTDALPANLKAAIQDSLGEDSSSIIENLKLENEKLKSQMEQLAQTRTSSSDNVFESLIELEGAYVMLIQAIDAIDNDDDLDFLIELKDEIEYNKEQTTNKIIETRQKEQKVKKQSSRMVISAKQSLDLKNLEQEVDRLTIFESQYQVLERKLRKQRRINDELEVKIASKSEVEDLIAFLNTSNKTLEEELGFN